MLFVKDYMVLVKNQIIYNKPTNFPLGLLFFSEKCRT